MIGNQAFAVSRLLWYLGREEMEKVIRLAEHCKWYWLLELRFHSLEPIFLEVETVALRKKFKFIFKLSFKLGMKFEKVNFKILYFSSWKRYLQSSADPGMRWSCCCSNRYSLWLGYDNSECEKNLCFKTTQSFEAFWPFYQRY